METSGSIAAMKRDPKIVKFYHSPQWKKISMNYKKSVGGLCENCMAKGIYTPGEIVHHKVHLTQENYGDQALMFGFDNLEALCQACHNDEHGRTKNVRRWAFVDGNLVTRESPL